MPQTVSTIVISLGESNALIPIAGTPTIKRHILRSFSLGVKKVYVIGHFTPETLELLENDSEIANACILNDRSKNPWATIYEESHNEHVLFLSNEHYTDIKTFQFALEVMPQNDQVVMLGNHDQDQIATARNRILLTANGEPISIHERARAEAVWMGMISIGAKVLQNLSNRRSGLHPETIKQASIIASSGKSYLQTIYSVFWERIDSNLMGSYATKEILFSIEEEGFKPLQKLEYGVTEKILNILPLTKNVKNTFLNFALLFCFSGGFFIPKDHLILSFSALSVCLIGIIMAVSATELKIILAKAKTPGLDYSLLAKRLIILGVCTHFMMEPEPDPFAFLAGFFTVVVTLFELKKESFIFEIERPIYKYSGCKEWLKKTLHFLSLDWVWYGLLLTTTFDLNSYFCILITEFFIVYTIFLIQIPTPKVYTLTKEQVLNENS